MGLLPKNKQYTYNTVTYQQPSTQAEKIGDILSKHYKKLFSKYVTAHKDVIHLGQTDEDLFQMAVIRTMETELPEVTTESVLDQFSIKFRTLKKYNMIQYYSMKNKVLPLEFQNEDGECFIPIEYYNNAISK